MSKSGVPVNGPEFRRLCKEWGFEERNAAGDHCVISHPSYALTITVRQVGEVNDAALTGAAKLVHVPAEQFLKGPFKIHRTKGRDAVLSHLWGIGGRFEDTQGRATSRLGSYGASTPEGAQKLVRGMLQCGLLIKEGAPLATALELNMLHPFVIKSIERLDKGHTEDTPRVETAPKPVAPEPVLPVPPAMPLDEAAVADALFARVCEFIERNASRSAQEEKVSMALHQATEYGQRLRKEVLELQGKLVERDTTIRDLRRRLESAAARPRTWSPSQAKTVASVAGAMDR